MDYNNIDVNSLKQEHKIRCNNRSLIYEKILSKSMRHIKTNADKDLTYAIFPIPEFILGMPLYNMPYCAAYVIHSLKKKGFQCKFFNPNIIFILWSYSNNPDNYKSITYEEPKMLEYNHYLANNDYVKNKNDDYRYEHGYFIKNNQDEYSDNESEMEISFGEPKKSKTKNIRFKSVDSYKPSGYFIR